MKYARFHQSGQVGIAVILVMVVLSTVGISLATRSASDVRTARQSQEATQTFSAAEAALEDILSQDQTFLEDTDSGEYTDIQDVNVDYTIGKETVLTTHLSEGATAEIDVSTATDGQVLRIEWSDTADCAQNPASIIISVINNEYTPPTSRQYGFALCDRGDNFWSPNSSPGTYQGQVFLVLLSNIDRVRVTPIYNDTDILVRAEGWELPTQEFIINSVAQNQLGRETKAIEVQRTTEYAPSIMEFALVSGNSIIK